MKRTQVSASGGDVQKLLAKIREMTTEDRECVLQMYKESKNPDGGRIWADDGEQAGWVEAEDD